jgi:hypothetical protein
MRTLLPLFHLILLSTFSVTVRAAHATSPDSVPSRHQNARHAGVGETIQISLTKSTGDSVPANVAWTATGGTITPSGLYIAGNTAGIYHVIAQTRDGRLADTATVVVMARLGTASVIEAPEESHSPPKSIAHTGPLSVEIGAPAITVDCKDHADFIRIDLGWPIMFVGSERQIKVGGCYHGRPINEFAYAYASEGSLTPNLRYESGALPGIVRIEIGSAGSLTVASKRLVVTPNLLQWGILVWLYQLWRNRKRRPRPPRTGRHRGLPQLVGAGSWELRARNS